MSEDYAHDLDQIPDAVPEVNGSAKRIAPWLRRTLCRELAAGEVKRAALARKYGVTPAAITLFAKRHGAEIDAIKRDLDDQFAGLWIADKAARIAAYQADLEASAADTKHAGYFEQIRTRTAILRAVAEELGQLPPRATLTIRPVVHVLEGVSPEVLK